MAGNRIALVLGINGSVGRATTTALLRRGWQIRALARDPGQYRGSWPNEVEWIPGDAMDARTVARAADGAQLLLHAVSPPQYRNWRQWAIPMLANAIEAASLADARLILPGNVYNYGPDAGAIVREDSPQNPLTRKGAIRVEMEGMLQAATLTRGLRSVIVRAGDYFGAAAATSVFAQIVLPAKQHAPVRYLGPPGVGHAWAYLPDLGETIALLADRQGELPVWDTFHFGGHWLPHGEEIAEEARRVLGSSAPIAAFPWLLVRLASPFCPLAREMAEMQYLWQIPLKLENTKLKKFLGVEPHTPFDEAVRTSIAGLSKNMRR